MKCLLFISLLFLVGVGGKAQGYQWAFNLGGTDWDQGQGITTDASGNVYVIGYFRDIADFDPSANTANLTSNGLSDIFVAKYDNAGNYLWAFNIGGTGADYGYSISTDTAGSGVVYVIGQFQNTADFDPSGNTANLTSNGTNDVFVAKYDSAGNYLWAFNVGGTEWDRGNNIDIDVSGNVNIIGFFTDTVDFDPSGNTANLTANGGNDIFIAKYDAGGNYLWAFNIGGINFDQGLDIATDASGDVYVTGYFTGIADFDPSGNTANLTSNNGSGDIFIAKYDGNGNYLWAFNVGGINNERGNSIATDPAGSGDIYVTGYFRDTADFDPSGNTANLTPNGFNWDIFVAKYDANGNYLWAFNIGGISADQGFSICTDPSGSGDVYVTGEFGFTADFDPSGNTANLTANGTSDIFVAKYDNAGNYLWAFNVGELNDDIGYSIATGPAGSGDVYVMGRFRGTPDFDPSGNTANLTSNGNQDAFVAKYDSTTIVGINSFVSHEPFLIYPNPTSGVFELRGVPIAIGKVLGLNGVEVFDLYGRLVLTATQSQIDMSSYPAGIYMVRAGEAVRKLIKQ